MVECNGWVKTGWDGVQLPCTDKTHNHTNFPDEVKEKVRDQDTPGKVAERMRRYRQRTKGKVPRNEKSGTPVTRKRTGNGITHPYAEIAWKAGQRVCAWCGNRVIKSTGQGHHILSRERGGSDDPSNIALVHRECHDKPEGLTLIVGRQPTVEEVKRAKELF